MSMMLPREETQRRRRWGWEVCGGGEGVEGGGECSFSLRLLTPLPPSATQHTPTRSRPRLPTRRPMTPPTQRHHLTPLSSRRSNATAPWLLWGSQLTRMASSSSRTRRSELLSITLVFFLLLPHPLSLISFSLLPSSFTLSLSSSSYLPLRLPIFLSFSMSLHPPSASPLPLPFPSSAGKAVLLPLHTLLFLFLLSSSTTRDIPTQLWRLLSSDPSPFACRFTTSNEPNTI